MKTTVTLLFLLVCMSALAQPQPAPMAPTLEFVCELAVQISPPLTVGDTPHGLRRIIPITGGTVEGPTIKGTILNGGADWQVIRADGVAELEAHYQFRTNDGVLIYIKNVGLRVATPEVAARISRGELVPPSEYYFRTVAKFEAPPGPYAWMNNTIFVCLAIRNPQNVLIQVWKVK